jgi:hypothetical protein
MFLWHYLTWFFFGSSDYFLAHAPTKTDTVVQNIRSKMFRKIIKEWDERADGGKIINQGEIQN